jgi:hypothetical protein
MTRRNEYVTDNGGILKAAMLHQFGYGSGIF